MWLMDIHPIHAGAVALPASAARRRRAAPSLSGVSVLGCPAAWASVMCCAAYGEAARDITTVCWQQVWQVSSVVASLRVCARALAFDVSAADDRFSYQSLVVGCGAESDQAEGDPARWPQFRQDSGCKSERAAHPAWFLDPTAVIEAGTSAILRSGST